MKSAPSETAELLHRVRQQLILAQVRIMELEDARDELAPKLADTEKLLTGAQNLADQKLTEADHLAKVLGDLQTQFEHLRHMQHVTNEALNQTRREKADVTASLAVITDRATAAEQRGSQLQKEIISLADQLAQLNASLSRVGLELAESNTTAAARLDRLNELDAEIRTLKTSRSWRWMAWLRAIERQLGGR
jgi:chromosome segregation ATPase